MSDFTLLQYSSVLFGVLCILVSYALQISWPRSSRNLPPGPKGIPIFGNTFQIPGTFVWLYFTEMANKYGSYYSR